ncbi:hypothetical protein NOV72_05748 [Caballeronia novacaledonica]|uniref:DUF3489 domain-containing protein n=1 Tax=Caballeronia novacaledonica TaxID=1544861 RepID=A0A2U3IEA2_9BURK|nr:DUF3489 domain-containing protein [Caballeronia novacaledonica]SPB18548.1 hypothetical protein NOV72_05748 [Caballeronia novacaledonica]
MATKTTASAAKKTTSKAAAKTAVTKATNAPTKASRTAAAKATTKPRTAATKPAAKPVETKVTPTRSRISAKAALAEGRAFIEADKQAALASAESATPVSAPPATTESKRSVSRENSAQARVVAMLCTPEGATLDAIMSATGWQAHTVRGFVSGTAKKKLGLTIESARIESKRTYRVVGA